MMHKMCENVWINILNFLQEQLQKQELWHSTRMHQNADATDSKF